MRREQPQPEAHSVFSRFFNGRSSSVTQAERNLNDVPSWSPLTTSIHRRFGFKYVAAYARADKCGATGQAGQSGLVAI